MSSRLAIAAGHLLLMTAGCGVIQRTAVNTMIPILDNSLAAAYRNGDVDLVEEGLPGNLLLVDGLIATRPEDRRLLTLGCQLYFSYGTGFIEERNPTRAARLYETAMGYGLRAFPNLAPGAAAGAGGLAAFETELLELERRDVPGLVWLAGSWSSWIKLNISSPHALAQLPRVELLAERIVELDGAFMYGMPYLLLGTTRALRPEPMGGSPERAREAFEAGFAVSERRFLMTHLFFAKYYCRQTFDEALFDTTISELLSADPAALKDAVLLNRVAQRQGKRLAEQKDELF